VAHHRAHALLRPAQLLLGALSLRDVAHDAGEVARLAQAELADRELHGEGGAVLALSHHFAAGPYDLGLSGAQVIGDVAVVLAPVRLRHKHPHVLPDDLARGIAEDALGGAIERVHRAALVDGDDAVDDVVDD
jgi:hypothetical protein